MRREEIEMLVASRNQINCDHVYDSGAMHNLVIGTRHVQPVPRVLRFQMFSVPRKSGSSLNLKRI